MDLLVEKATQADSIEAEARRLRPCIGIEVKDPVAVEILMTVETSHAQTLIGALSVLSLIELLLRKGCQQQTQAFHLHRRQNTVHDFIVVLDGQHLTARYVAEFRR